MSNTMGVHKLLRPGRAHSVRIRDQNLAQLPLDKHFYRRKVRSMSAYLKAVAILSCVVVIVAVVSSGGILIKFEYFGDK